MASIIQFMHQGTEHGPDNKNHKEWNTGDHKRKFLISNAEYLDNNVINTGQVFFWGEWEPQSSVRKLSQGGNPLNPKWLHKPCFLPNPIPNTIGLQNTDPYVFENEFKYFVCQQFKKQLRLRTTYLAQIEVGSLILFGSAKYPNTQNAIFQLDTVFVVNSWIDYNPRNNPLDLPNISALYRDVVYKKAFPRRAPNINLRLYFGASYQNQINNMYSFAPVKLSIHGNVGFQRLSLNNNQYINPNLTQGFKISSGLTIQDVYNFWISIRNLSRQQGYLEGLRFGI